MRYRTRRKLTMVVLAAGVFLGFGSAIAHHGGGHHDRFEERVTRVCTTAVERALAPDAPPAADAAQP